MGIYGFRAGSYNLLASGSTPPFGPTLTIGQPVNGSLNQGQWVYYQVTGATLIELYNLTADLDLYVKAGSQPTFTSYDCRPHMGGATSEICSGLDPRRAYYVGVHTFRAGSYTIEAF